MGTDDLKAAAENAQSANQKKCYLLIFGIVLLIVACACFYGYHKNSSTFVMLLGLGCTVGGLVCILMAFKC